MACDEFLDVTSVTLHENSESLDLSCFAET